MILLRHLRITAFKHLRAIDLWLPRRGSVLIEGHNESGKSTLFEAIYFALYGKALVGEEKGNPSLESLLPHGEARAGVQLTIAVGATELEIARTLTRGAKTVKHDAEVRIHRPGRPAETISAAQAVTDAIVREMNGLDSAVLRNSCLMEQQALDRIETLSNSNREMAIAKLLGIDALQRIETDLKVVRKDEALLAQADARLEVARHQQQARQAGETARRTGMALRAARARAALESRDALSARLREIHASLDAVTRETAQLGDRLRRATTLEALLVQSDDAARLLRDVEQHTAALETLRARQGHAASPEDIAAAQERVAALRELEAELTAATQASTAADRNAQLARFETDSAAAETRERAQQAQVAAARRHARIGGILAGIPLTVAVVAAITGILTDQGLLLPLAALTLFVAAFLLLRWQRLWDVVRGEQSKLATLAHEKVQLRATYAAVRHLLANGNEQPVNGANTSRDSASQPALSDVETRIRTLGIEPAVTAVAAERIAAEQALTRMAEQTASTPDALTAQQGQVADAHDACAGALRDLAAALSQAGVAVPGADPPLATVADLKRAHEALRQPIPTALADLDIQAAQRQRGSLEAREQQARAQAAELIAQRDAERERLVAGLAEQGIAATGDEPLETLVAQWPDLARQDDPDALAAALERARATEEQLRQQVAALCQKHSLDADAVDALDADECQKAYDELEQTLRQRRLAADLADEVFRRIVQRVLPETEMHMRVLLPDLTDGRYRDVTLLSGDDDSADLRIRVWDEQAGRYVGKQLFSGGTRDQVSLALRLAFALATLPKELGAMPGFIFLDEPLSSFDDRRSQALVDVLTRGPIARQFPQVFLISHSQSFDPAAFTCSLRMAGGRVAASTLPDEHEARALWDGGLAPATN